MNYQQAKKKGVITRGDDNIGTVCTYQYRSKDKIKDTYRIKIDDGQKQ